MAARGLYSFDTQLIDGEDAYYDLIALPPIPMRLDELPSHIQNALSVTTLQITFPNTKRITEKETLKIADPIMVLSVND